MTSPGSPARRPIAAFGLFVILFQAILFGWHHHNPIVSGRLPGLIVANPTSPPQVADDEDGCEICQVLHHLTAAPLDVVAASLPLGLAAGPRSHVSVFTALPPALAFHARAPPSPEAAIG